MKLKPCTYGFRIPHLPGRDGIFPTSIEPDAGTTVVTKQSAAKRIAYEPDRSTRMHVAEKTPQ